jgi:hypothetical protein
MSSGTRRQDHEGDAKHPPRPADADDVGMIAQQGIIGQCLSQALHDCLGDTNWVHDKEKDDDASEWSDGSIPAAVATLQPKKKSRNKMKLQPHMVDSVMKQFGQAVAESKWTNALSSSSSSCGTNDGRKINEPPAALLKGTIDHYNRLGGKWRIVVEGGQLKRRVRLARDRMKKVRPPLWLAVGDQETVSLPSSLQLLAYDDLI